MQNSPRAWLQFRGSRASSLSSVFKQHAVGQAGQRIVVGQMGELVESIRGTWLAIQRQLGHGLSSVRADSFGSTASPMISSAQHP